jgi:hypothetical protein
MYPLINPQLSSSVGRGKLNRPPDVLIIQRLLNGQQLTPLNPLKEDSSCGPKTIAAIEEFQRRVVKMVRPDGIVDMGGQTFNLLAKGMGPQAPTAGLKIQSDKGV